MAAGIRINYIRIPAAITFYYRLQHTNPIFLTLITDQRWIGQSQHDTNVGHYDLSAFILVYSQEILSVALLDVGI